LASQFKPSDLGVIPVEALFSILPEVLCRHAKDGEQKPWSLVIIQAAFVATEIVIKIITQRRRNKGITSIFTFFMCFKVETQSFCFP